jgi:hypothetical protein
MRCSSDLGDVLLFTATGDSVVALIGLLGTVLVFLVAFFLVEAVAGFFLFSELIMAFV